MISIQHYKMPHSFLPGRKFEQHIELANQIVLLFPLLHKCHLLFLLFQNMSRGSTGNRTPNRRFTDTRFTIKLYSRVKGLDLVYPLPTAASQAYPKLGGVVRIAETNQQFPVAVLFATNRAHLSLKAAPHHIQDGGLSRNEVIIHFPLETYNIRKTLHHSVGQDLIWNLRIRETANFISFQQLG